MAGQAEAPGVGQPLTVEETEIRGLAELAEGFQEQWPFAEREIAGNVGKPHAPRGPGRGHGIQTRKGHDGDAGPDRPAVRREGAVGAGDEPDGVILDHLGDVYLRLDQVDQARDAWKRALSVFDKEADADKIVRTQQKIDDPGKFTEQP
jgi:hypothetical protein